MTGVSLNAEPKGRGRKPGRGIEAELKAIERERTKLHLRERKLQEALKTGGLMTIKDFARREKVSVRVVWYRIHKGELKTVSMMVGSRQRTLIVM